MSDSQTWLQEMLAHLKSGDLVRCYHSGTDEQMSNERRSYSANGPWTAEMNNWLSYTNDDKMLSECVNDKIIDRLNAVYGTCEIIQIVTIMSHINKV